MCLHAQAVRARDGVMAILTAMRTFAADVIVQQQAGEAIEELTQQDEAMRVRVFKGREVKDREEEGRA